MKDLLKKEKWNDGYKPSSFVSAKMLMSVMSCQIQRDVLVLKVLRTKQKKPNVSFLITGE